MSARVHDGSGSGSGAIFGDPLWERSHRLTATIYRLTRRLPEAEQRGLADELRTAAAATTAAIAAGLERAGVREQRAAYDRAGQRAAETEYLLLLTDALRYLDRSAVKLLLGETRAIQRRVARRPRMRGKSVGASAPRM